MYIILSEMSLIQPLKFKTWETRHFKMPRLETPRFQTRHRVTIASGLRMQCVYSQLEWITLPKISEIHKNFKNPAKLQLQASHN